MKRSTKLAAAVAAALTMSSGAYAQDLDGAAANNLGPAVVGAAQAEGGLFGGLGATGTAAVSMGLMTAAFAGTIGNFEASSDPVPDITPPVPQPPPPPPPHHHH